MNFHTKKVTKICSLLIIVFAITMVSFAQNTPVKADSTIIYNDLNKNLDVAAGNNLYCAGYVQSGSINRGTELVGAEEEKDRHVFTQGDLVYISSGAREGVQIGDMYSVIRPRGEVATKWTKKKNLGHYVQELGAVKVINVMQDVSVARVETSCGVMMFGDLLNPIPNRVSPKFVKRPELNRFAQSSGKANGRIFMARDYQEMISREQIVYVDLGREDNVKVGDYMTIYRPLGTGNIFAKVLDENIDNKSETNQSERYKGGLYSNQAQRKKGERSRGKTLNTEDVKDRRPDGLRRVVGELVILNVLEKTATAMVVRNASEIHTGDRVELQ